MRSLTKTLIFFSLIGLYSPSFSQQGNNWYFGEEAGITFNTSPPSVLLNSGMYAGEGCAAMSDSLGNILFYTSGVKVYNKLNQLMANGDSLMGHVSSSNSAIIVPHPGNPLLYYIFTTDAVETGYVNGYRYSVVDMSQDGGLGAVTLKNVLLYAKGTERLTATKHANGTDFWVITKAWNNDTFQVFKVDCGGINITPVISHTGVPTLFDGGWSDGIGCTKVSPDGTKLATTRIHRRGWEIFNFDNATGIISNPIYIPLNLERVYGVEFSLDSKLIYIGSECCSPSVSNNSSIHQYDLNVYDSAAIKNSMYIVVDTIHDYIGALQLGPDNKLYASQEHQPFVHRINFPNVYGAGCGFTAYAINLGGHLAQRGLPAFSYSAISNPNVDFTFTLQPDCQTVNFSATSTITPPLTWTWSFGDGTTATGQNVTHVYSTVGNNYNVVLTVTNPNICGATGTKMKIVSLNRTPPHAAYNFTTQCGSLSAGFTDASTIDSGYSIISRLWDFRRDGQNSFAQNPSHNYTAYGQYTVKLTVTSSDGCQSQDTLVKMVTVSPKPVSNFVSTAGCLNFPVQFTDQSTVAAGNVVQWYWNFGDGQTSSLQNPLHTYNSNGSYTVRLVTTGSNSCVSDTFQRIVIVTPKPVADFNFANGCINTLINFTDNSTISSGSINSWYWNFGNGNVPSTQNGNALYSIAGNFSVKHVAFANGGCPSDTVIKTISIQSKPASNFSFTTNCGSKIVSFADNSAATNGAIVSWYWNFGDAVISSQQNPSHGYLNFGNYAVKLVTSTANGCTSDTIMKTVLVPAKPSVNFILPPVCLLDAFANFTNTTTIADNTILSYHWNFGDFNAAPAGSDTSILVHPQYHYSAAAVYSVRLKAQSTNGCSDSLTKIFTVNGAVPVANFRTINPLSLCSNSDIQIKDSSTVDFGNITRVRIFWGDGDSTIDINPNQAPNGKTYNHRYPYFGIPATKNYSITMYSYSGTVCVSSIVKTITVNASPQIQFNPLNEICHETLPYNLTGASELWGLPGNGYYSGTGIINQLNGTFSPQVADTGNHYIAYTFITTEGCRADSLQILRVNPTPTSSFSFNEACLPNASIQFSNNSSVPGYAMNQLQWQWNFDDPTATATNPNTSTATNPSHIFSSLDTFDVRLTTTSPKGCKKDSIISIVPDINIFAQPIADFKLDSSKLFCEGTPTVFINTSDSMGRNLIKWWWNFGDGSVDSITRKPFHLYPSSGNFLVNLQVENTKGCFSTIATKQISIESIPVADFSFDTTCYGRPIQFSDLSTNVFGAIINWQWNFGDGNSSAVQNPQHTYFNYSNYSVRLQASTFNGCTSAVVVKSIPIKSVAISAGKDTVAAIGQPLQLLATGANTYTWSPSTGLNNPNIPNPMAILQQEQIYFVKGVTQAGCIGYDTLKIVVFPQPDIYVPTGFTPNHDGKNDYLHPICIGVKALEYFTVYNRWGQMVFTTKNMDGKWDGSLSGVQQPTGSFVWMVKGISYDGKVIERKGTCTLIK